jgi:hypothetical protein
MTTYNVTFNDNINNFKFKFWKILKLEKFLQIRYGWMYYMIVMNYTNMDPY